MSLNPNKRLGSEQDLQNLSFDPTFLTSVEQLVGSPDGVNLYKAQVDSSGAIKVSPGVKPSVYDTKALTQTSTTDAWAYKLSGVLKATKTITYTDSTKSTISTIVWS